MIGHSPVLLTSAEGSVTWIPCLARLSRELEIYHPDDFSSQSLRDRAVLIDARSGGTEQVATIHAVRRRADARMILAVVDDAALMGIDSDWPVDDFIAVTASPAELAARLRLRVVSRPVSPLEGTSDRMVVGPIVMDSAERWARVEGRELGLTFREFNLLHYLGRQPGRTVSRAELMESVWGRQARQARDPTLRTVDVHVARLRRKLGPSYGPMLKTIRKVGYRLVPPADLASSAV